MRHSHQSAHPAVTLSVRVPSESRDRLEALANVTGRTKSFLAAEAIERYLASQLWQITAIGKAIETADSNDAVFIEHHVVSDWLNSWGEENEQDPFK